MKRLFYVAVVIVVAAVLGCGGGGGGGGGGNGTTDTTGTITNISLQPVFANTGATPNLGELAQNNVITLQLVGLSSTTGQQVVLSGGTFSTTAPATVATLSGSQLTIKGASSGTQYTVSGVYQGNTYQKQFACTGPTAQVYGTVVSNSGPSVAGAIVEFFDNKGDLLAQVTASSSGLVEANVPTTAVGFTVQLSSLSAGFFNAYTYDKLGFTITTGNCLTTLPKLTLNQVTSLPYPIFPAPLAAGAPPPPSGCGP